MPLHHSPINLSPPPTFVSPIHHFLSQEQCKKSFYFPFNFRLSGWMTSVLTPSWIPQSLHPPTVCYVPLHLLVSSLGWTLPSAVLLPVESSSLSALPAAREVAPTPHATAFLEAGLALEQLILKPQRSSCSAPGWSRTLLAMGLSSYWASVAWGLGRFFSRYFLDTKAIILLSVKSESLNKGSRHLSFSNNCVNVRRAWWICSLAS